MASAPKALASIIWYSSIMNSLRNNGKSETALAIVRSSNDPPKYFPSVNIDIPQTPALS